MTKLHQHRIMYTFWFSSHGYYLFIRIGFTEEFVILRPLLSLQDSVYQHLSNNVPKCLIAHLFCVNWGFCVDYLFKPPAHCTTPIHVLVSLQPSNKMVWEILTIHTNSKYVHNSIYTTHWRGEVRENDPCMLIPLHCTYHH